jgi:putative hydrolase of the HAD superfamily
MIKTIVFDFGNVIGFFDHRLTTERLAVHTDMPADDLHRHLFGGSLEEAYESGRLSTEAFLLQVRQTCRLRCPTDFIRTAYADIFRPNAEVCALLPELKRRYRLLLLSNTNDLHARHYRRQFADVLQDFEALVLSHEVGHRKPRPEVFEHCRRLAGCAAAECLFIDDLPANVAGARACGWHGIVYRDLAELRRELQAHGIITGNAECGMRNAE